MNLYIFLLEELQWVSITPSLNKLLGHIWELMELNGGRGLKSWCKEGLEANNKTLRLIRARLSHKSNQLVNLEDCFKHLWIPLDLLVVFKQEKGKGSCSLCSLFGHRKRSCPNNPRRVAIKGSPNISYFLNKFLKIT